MVSVGLLPPWGPAKEVDLAMSQPTNCACVQKYCVGSAIEFHGLLKC